MIAGNLYPSAKPIKFWSIIFFFCERGVATARVRDVGIDTAGVTSFLRWRSCSHTAACCESLSPVFTAISGFVQSSTDIARGCVWSPSHCLRLPFQYVPAPRTVHLSSPDTFSACPRCRHGLQLLLLLTLVCFYTSARSFRGEQSVRYGEGVHASVCC